MEESISGMVAQVILKMRRIPIKTFFNAEVNIAFKASPTEADAVDEIFSSVVDDSEDKKLG